MTFNPNDPKWTAYVAGELDAAERAAVEQELAESAEARALVADIERVIGTLVSQLKTEPVPAAAAPTVALAPAASALPKGRSIPWAWLAVGGTAACVAGALMIPALNGARSSRSVATVDNRGAEINDSSSLASSEASTAPTATRPSVTEFDREQSHELRVGDAPLNEGISADNDSVRDYRVEGRKANADVAKNPIGNKGDERWRSGEYNYSSVPRDSSLERTGKLKELAPLPTSLAPPALPIAPEFRTDQTQGLVAGDKLAPSKPFDPAGQPADVRGVSKTIRAPGQLATDSPPSPAATTAPSYEALEEKSEASSKRTTVPNATTPAPNTRKPGDPDLYFKGYIEQPARPTSVSGLAPSVDPAAPGPSDITASSSAKPSSQATPAPAVNAPVPLGEDFADGGKDKNSRFGLAAPQADREAGLPRPDVGGEAYEQVTDNAFMPARENPLSTFSIDVDTASYSNIRRFLTQNRMLPPPAAVRIEEMVNYFRYDYPQPGGDTPFQANIEVASCPWQQEHRLVRVGIKGREIASNKRPPSNLVFLVDVSGSMSPANKLPLVKEGLKMLTRQLTENDRIAIVVYAGSSGLVLPSTTGDKQQTILDALDRLEAGGSTNGAQGIQLAYEIALQNFLKGCTNRVILATDGDFNVGITDRGQLTSLIEQQAKTGVFLTTLGFGMGNIKDATLEQLADKGNGAYAYVDDLREAKKVLVDEMSGTLVTIAKDVKIQIEFNPAEVGSYRLIGYENRIMKHEDFNNDAKDAGEIGAGHTVTALYEVVPVGQMLLERPTVDPLKYQPKPEVPKAEPVAGEHLGELLTLKLRYKQPDGDTSKLLEYPVKDSGQRWAQASGDFKFAASVALFGMILRNSPHKGTATLDAVAELANEGRGSDESGYRQEFISLVQTAKGLGK